MNSSRFVAAFALATLFPVVDLMGQTTVLATLSDQDAASAGVTESASISGNGRFVGFASAASDLVQGDHNGFADVFVRDLQDGTTERVTVPLGLGEANGASGTPRLSRSGRYVCFTSDATNLVGSDTNAHRDVYVFDRDTGVTTLVSVTTAGAQANGDSDQPSISADGRFIAFSSQATNLDPLDTDARRDVYVRDLVDQKTYLASRKNTIGMAPGTDVGDSQHPWMVADGSVVLFDSNSAFLLHSDDNDSEDVFRFVIGTQELTQITVDDTGKPLQFGGRKPAANMSGRFIAFETRSKLAPNDNNSDYDVYLIDLTTPGFELQSASDLTGVTPKFIGSYDASISGNGRYVAWNTLGVLGAADQNTTLDVYLRDRTTGDLVLVSDAPGAAAGDGHSGLPSVSDKGGRVAYLSASSNLVAGDTNGKVDAFVTTIVPSDASGEADLAVAPSLPVGVHYVLGDPLPKPQPFLISNIGAGVLTNLGWAVATDPPVPWLSFSKSFGLITGDVGEDVIEAQAHPENLPTGIYQTDVVFQNVLDATDYVRVRFTMRVVQAPSQLCVDGPLVVNAAYVQGGQAPPKFQYVVSNCGPTGSTLDWEAFIPQPNPGFVLLSETAGALEKGELEVVDLVLDPAGLSLGDHTATVLFRNLDDPAQTAIVHVTLSIGKVQPALCVPDVSPVAMSYTLGDPTPLPIVSRTVKNCGEAGSQLAWGASIAPPVSWLLVTPSGGTLGAGQTGPVDFRFKPDNLGPGLYKTTVTFTNLNDAANHFDVPVAFAISQPAATLCLGSTAAIDQTWQIGGPSVPNATVIVKNCGPAGSELIWGQSAQPAAPWLLVVPPSGSIPAGGQQAVTLVFDEAGLAAGNHATNLTFVNSANPSDAAAVAVKLKVTAPLADLCLDNANPLVATYSIGGAQPPHLSRTVTNCGDPLSTLDFTVLAQPVASWLKIAPQSGSLAAGGASTIGFDFDPTGLPAGKYETHVAFANVADPADVVIALARLEVSQPAADLAVAGGPISATYVIGDVAPPATSVVVTNAGPNGSSLSWFASTLPPAGWLSFLPLGGTLPGGSSKAVGLSLNPAGLAPGDYSTIVRFQNSANVADLVDVAVSLKVEEPLPDLELDSAAPISATYTLGNPDPAPVVRIVKNVGNKLSTLPFFALTTPPVGWVSVTPPAGSLTGAGAGKQQAVSIALHPGALPKGQHSTTLRFLDVTHPSDFVDVAVSIDVAVPPADLCIDSAAAVHLDYTLGSPTPAPVVRTVSNCGPAGSKLQWAASVQPPVGWLIAAPSGGTLAGGTGQPFTLVPNVAGLAAGTYATAVKLVNVDDATDTFTIPVALDVVEPAANLCLDSVVPVTAEYVIGGASPPAVPRTVKNCGPQGSTLDFAAVVEPASPWLAVAPPAGKLPGGAGITTSIVFNTAGLTKGPHSAQVRYVNTKDPTNFALVPVLLNVVEAVPHLCIDSAAPIQLAHVLGQTAPADQVRVLTNCGHELSTLPFLASTVPDTSWLHLSPKSGVLAGKAPGNSQAVALHFTPEALAPGNYSCLVRFADVLDPTDKIDVAVQLEVKEPAAALCIDSAAPIAVQFDVGGTSPATVVRKVKNCGPAGSTLDFVAGVEPPVGWLTVTPPSGKLASGQESASSIAFNVASLALGQYSTQVRYANAKDPTNFAIVPVTLTVHLPGPDLALDSTAPVSVTHVLGTTPPADVVRVVKNVGEPLSSLTFMVTTLPAVGWLHAAPGGGVLTGTAPNNALPVALQFTPDALPAGNHSCLVRFASLTDPSDKVDVAVSIEVKEPPADLCVNAAPISVDFSIGGPAPPADVELVQNCGPSFSKLQWTASIEPPVTWVVGAPGSGLLAGGASQGFTLAYNVVALSAGPHTTTVKFQNAADPTDVVVVPVTVNVKEPDADLCLDSVAPVAAQYDIGGNPPASVVRVVKNCGPAGSVLDFAATVEPASPWLSVAPPSGTLASGMQLATSLVFNVANLAEGNYSAQVRYVDVADPTNFALVPVSLAVHLPKPDLTLTDASPIQSSFEAGGTPPADVVKIVKNSGDPLSSLTFAVSTVPAVSWLQASPRAGVLLGTAPSNQQAVTIHLDPTGLSAGNHSCLLRFTNLLDASDEVAVPVSFDVSEPAADLAVAGAPIAVEYDLGFDTPGGATWTVSNAGPTGSTLQWTATAVPPVSWLFLSKTTGSLPAGVQSNVDLMFNVGGLTPGMYLTNVLFQNTEVPGDTVTIAVELDVVDPKPDLSLQKGVESVEVDYVIGDPVPDPVVVQLENTGHENSSLSYTISVVPPVDWLAIDPLFGVLAPGQASQPISLAFAPAGLVDGDYVTTVHFQNVEDPQDFVDLPVTLSIGNISFVPGDTIDGEIKAADQAHELEFDGLEHEFLKMLVKSPVKKFLLQVSVYDASDHLVKSLKVKPGAKGAKKKIKLPVTGHYKLRIEPLKGKLGAFDIKTDRKLPKAALKFTKVLSGGGGTAQVGPLMLAGGTFGTLIEKTQTFTGQLGLTLTKPSGGTLVLDEFATATESGISVNGVPSDEPGKYVFTVSGFTGVKSKVKATVIPLQPPPGTNLIVLP